MYPRPTLEELRASVAVFGRMPRPDKSLDRFRERTGASLNLREVDHAEALLEWLNAWGCRLDGSADGRTEFVSNVRAWWDEQAHLLPADDAVLAELADADVERAAEAFGTLRGARASWRRTVASTAAAKTLYALRPLALLAWDEAIARSMHGARDRPAYADHLRWGRAAAQALLDAGTQHRLSSEVEIAAELGREGASFAKLLDEHLYVTISRQR